MCVFASASSASTVFSVFLKCTKSKQTHQSNAYLFNNIIYNINILLSLSMRFRKKTLRRLRRLRRLRLLISIKSTWTQFVSYDWWNYRYKKRIACVSEHHSQNKKQTRQLENQRLPGINAAKIWIILETSKYFCNYLYIMLYTHHFSAYLGYMI